LWHWKEVTTNHKNCATGSELRNSTTDTFYPKTNEDSRTVSFYFVHELSHT
jgi:hypothetical protein